MHKHMLRAFGLSLLAALGLMAFAAAAQAEDLTNGGTAGKVRVLGLENLPAVLTATQIGASTLLVPALNIELVCQAADVLNGSIGNKASHAEGLVEILFLDCLYWSTKVVKHAGGVELLLLVTKLPCELLEEGTLAKGDFLAKAILLVRLHNGRTYVLAEPDTKEPLKAGEPFAGVKITTPSECPLPGLVTVTGSTVFKVTLGDLALGANEAAQLALEEVWVEIESDKTLNKLLGDKLLYGANEAFIDGKALVWLTGPHLGCKWGLI